MHQDCNLNLTTAKKSPVVFYNLQNCDSHLLFQEVGKIWFQNVIPKAIGQCMSFTIEQIKNVINPGLPLVFIGILYFLNVLLNNLVKK